MRLYSIMREPGPAARRRHTFWAPRPKKVGAEAGEGQKDALGEFVHARYLSTGNRQYAGHRFEWHSARAASPAWKPDDWTRTSTPDRDRTWSVVVTLRNGTASHEARFLAWPALIAEARR